MIKQEDWEDYKKRSGDFFGTIYPGNVILDDDEHGFCTMDVMEGMLMVHQCYGDGEYWTKEIRRVAKENNIKEIRFLTRRNPKAFEKKFGFKFEGYIMSIEAGE